MGLRRVRPLSRFFEIGPIFDFVNRFITTKSAAFCFVDFLRFFSSAKRALCPKHRSNNLTLIFVGFLDFWLSSLEVSNLPFLFLANSCFRTSQHVLMSFY